MKDVQIRIRKRIVLCAAVAFASVGAFAWKLAKPPEVDQSKSLIPEQAPAVIASIPVESPASDELSDLTNQLKADLVKEPSATAPPEVEDKHVRTRPEFVKKTLTTEPAPMNERQAQTQTDIVNETLAPESAMVEEHQKQTQPDIVSETLSPESTMDKRRDTHTQARADIVSDTFTTEPTFAEQKAPLADPILSRQTASTAESDEEEVDHELRLSAGAGFTTLAATDKTNNSRANLNSNSDINVAIAWKQRWTQSFVSYFDLMVRKIGFEPSTNRQKSLSGTDHTLTRFTFGAESKLGRRTTLNYGFTYGHELFAQGLDSTTVVIDQLPLLNVFLTGNYDLYRRGKTAVGLTAGAAYYLSGSTDTYSIDPGFSYMGAVSLRRDFITEAGRTKSLLLQVGYQERNQNTAIVRISEQRIFTNLIFTLPLFEDSRRSPLR